mgnify:CR=1 FL=1
MTPHLLLVEDEAPLREATAERLREHGYQVVEADSGEVAQQHLTDFAFDVVVTDLRLPGIDGTAVVQAAREHYPEIVTVVVTGYGTVEEAVAAIKQGANEFIPKPFERPRCRHGTTRKDGEVALPYYDLGRILCGASRIESLAPYHHPRQHRAYR